MKKYYYSFFFLSLTVFILSSCNNNTEPTNPNEFEIIGEPLTIEIDINPDSLIIEDSPNYSIDYSALKLNGINLTAVKYYCPVQNLDVDREFVVTTKDSFTVEIKNCKTKLDWQIDFGDFDNWTNSEISLLNTEKTIITDSTTNIIFTFKTEKSGKGYICFIEKNSLGQISSNESHGLLVGYSTNALNKILLNVDEITWKYNTGENTFSTVSVSIKGTTNIYRLRGKASGDGEIMANEITIQNDNSFEIEIPVAFSHVEGVTLKTNSELLLYGTVGLPKRILLINPKSDLGSLNNKLIKDVDTSVL